MDGAGPAADYEDAGLLRDPEWREAVSWGLASAIVRRHPEFRIHELHPYDIYDVLEIRGPSGTLLHLNRSGSIHHSAAGLPNIVMKWPEVLNSKKGALNRLEEVTEIGHPKTTPAATPSSLSYRFIAAAVAATAAHRGALVPLQGLFDDGLVFAPRAELFKQMNHSAAREAISQPASSHTRYGHAAAAWWFLTRSHGDEVVLAIDVERGIAAKPGSEWQEFEELYQQSRRRIMPAVVELLAEDLP